MKDTTRAWLEGFSIGLVVISLLLAAIDAFAAAQERERTLNDELYYACELAIAYAHSEKDKEWAAERIEELMPPEQEAADESL